jgi:hypothetical protein
MGISWFVVSRYILELSRIIKIILITLPSRCVKAMEISDFAFSRGFAAGAFVTTAWFERDKAVGVG